jgi:zinc/manganese transport system substrate-binding protein
VAKADIVISNGMQLEIGWLPKIISLSGNSKVQMDTKGYCDASVGVTKIGVMKNVDRSMGDVHPDGNPHYTLSIPRMIESMDTIKNCLLKNGFNQNKIELNFQKIKAKMNKALKGFKYKFSGNKYYVFHREFNYLGNDLKMTFMESLEKVPGVLPSASYLTQLAVKSKKDKPLKVLAGSSSSRKILEKFKEFSNIDYTQLDLHPKRDEDYLDFIEKLIRKISVK